MPLQDELRFLAIASSPAFIWAPDGRGCAERFIRTLKEQLLWVRTFRMLEDLRKTLHKSLVTCTEHWLIERHDHRSPTAMRRAVPETRLAAQCPDRLSRKSQAVH